MQISSTNRQMPMTLIQQKPPTTPVARDSDHDGDVDGAPKASAPPQGKGSLVDQFA